MGESCGGLPHHMRFSPMLTGCGVEFKRPVLGDETARRARTIDLAYVKMTVERDAHHFAWFVAVLGTFLSRF